MNESVTMLVLGFYIEFTWNEIMLGARGCYVTASVITKVLVLLSRSQVSYTESVPFNPKH
jgi:hypothetical protein